MLDDGNIMWYNFFHLSILMNQLMVQYQQFNLDNLRENMICSIVNPVIGYKYFSDTISSVVSINQLLIILLQNFLYCLDYFVYLNAY